MVDSAWVRSALTPLSAIQSACANWLKAYFYTHGDSKPDEEGICLSVGLKRDIYDKYVNEKQCVDKKYVSLQVFYSLWNVLFPRVKIRTYCDIPGHCDTCYNIDKGRRSSDDRTVHQKYKEAHILHRGGLFELERNE